VRIGIRVSTPFEKTPEPATMGGYLLFVFSMSFVYFLIHRKMSVRIIFGALSLLFIVPLFYTLSRASYMGVVVSYLVIIYLIRNRGTVFLMLLMSLAVVPYVLPHQVVKRAAYTFQGDAKYGYKVGNVYVEESAAVRIRSYLRVLTMLKKAPLLGFGVTGAGFIDGQYFRVLAETGIAGFLVFMWIQFSVLKLAYGLSKNGKNEFVRILAMGFFAGHIGLLVHATGSSTFIIIRIMEPFWFLTAIMAHLNKMSDDSEKEEIGEKLPLFYDEKINPSIGNRLVR